MLGVCYYPEQWPEALWEEDAKRMAALGLTYVRIGEFSWSAIEPHPGQFRWEWLDRIMGILDGQKLKVVLGTPTATPPKWLIDRHPDCLAHDAKGQPRRFGSRRHYCFSSGVYRNESARITEAFAKRYGHHPALAGWQTDNEFGCHDTVLSFSPDAARAFRAWLERHYGSIKALNEAWGNRFWSQEYQSFAEIDLPMQAVTELNPAHRFDFHRFSSDQVASFNREQVAIIRKHSSGRFVTHNFMGAFLAFDHWAVGRDLDLASWDSYPLGFTDSIPWLGLSEADRLAFAQTGHPDISAFHHDLYRGVGHGRFWVMEQQPGPVNWAFWNPAPAPGMVRLWTWEALAHGADVVSYFRWRQAPFAQEQMHAGLNRPDNVLDQGGLEAERVAAELKQPWAQTAMAARAAQAPVALVFDYASMWMTRIQPQGMSYDAFAQVYAWYGAARSLGLDVDIVPPGAPLAGYRLALVPVLTHVSDGALEAFRAFEGVTVFGPRSGSKTEHFRIPDALPPGPLQQLLPIKVARVESLRPGLTRPVALGNRLYEASHWVERVEALGTGLEILAQFGDGAPALVRAGNRVYSAFLPAGDALAKLISDVVAQAGLTVQPVERCVRVRRRGAVTFAFNFSGAPVLAPAPAGAKFVSGGPRIGAYDFSAWTP